MIRPDRKTVTELEAAFPETSRPTAGSRNNCTLNLEGAAQ